MSRAAGLMMLGYLGGADGFYDYTGAGTMALDINPAVGLVESGGFIESIADQSGNANNFAKVNDLSRPAYVAADAAYNNKPVISFTGIQMLLIGPATDSFYSNTNGCHIFVVGQSSASSDHWIARWKAAEQYVRFRTDYSIFHESVGAGGSSEGYTVQTSKTLLETWWLPSTEHRMWLNGVQEGEADATAPASIDTGGATEWAIGATSDYSNYLNTGKIARILVYAQKLADADAAAVRAALNAEYAIY